jgi:hypothetical protein
MAAEDLFPDISIGYPKLAARVEIQPELSIYRRFGALNTQNLLYFQAQLTDLEASLRRQQVLDDTSTHGKKSYYAKSWFRLEDSAVDGDTKQLDLVLKIREVLREFSEYACTRRLSGTHIMYIDDALIQQSVILKLPAPKQWDLHYLQNYLATKGMGPRALMGRDVELWGSYKPDLVALQPRTERDAFSMWAAKKAVGRLFTYCFARFVKPSRTHGLVGIEDTIVYRATYGITSILASMIPVLSIIVLYYVESMPARLATITVFNLIVSICLMGLAGAKRAEIFAITAAYVWHLPCIYKELTVVDLLPCRSFLLEPTNALLWYREIARMLPEAPTRLRMYVHALVKFQTRQKMACASEEWLI